MEETEAKILVIDDESGIREGCIRALRPHGYSVETAANSQDAIQKIREGEFDLILLDVMMPDGRGIDLLSPIQESDPDIVCIIITGYATVEMAVEAIKLGAYDFISKPFTSEILLMTVEQGLEKRRLSLETKRLQTIEGEAAELARSKEEMERLDEFKTKFTLMVTHELRAPTSALKSLLLSLQKGYVPPDLRKEVLQRAIDRAQELLDLVNDLLNLAAAREELAQPEREVISLADALDEVVHLFQALAADKYIEISVHVHRRPLVQANADQIGLLWTNLISNAIKYTPEAGRIVVVLDQNDEWAIGTVEDTGIGISPEHQEDIFKEFYRTPDAKKFAHMGTGLGLHLVKLIVERHGGEIKVESMLGRGSRFVFSLPVFCEDANESEKLSK